MLPTIRKGSTAWLKGPRNRAYHSGENWAGCGGGACANATVEAKTHEMTKAGARINSPPGVKIGLKRWEWYHGGRAARTAKTTTADPDFPGSAADRLKQSRDERDLFRGPFCSCGGL